MPMEVWDWPVPVPEVPPMVTNAVPKGEDTMIWLVTGLEAITSLI